MDNRREKSRSSGRSSGGRGSGNGLRRDSRDSNRGPRRFGGGNRGGFQRREPAEKHKATCSECGKECEVPFKPTQGKPVYCFECFKKKNPRPQRRNFH